MQRGPSGRRTSGSPRLLALSGHSDTIVTPWGRYPRGGAKSGGVPACGRGDAAARWHTKEAAGRRGGAGRDWQEGAGAGGPAIKPPPRRLQASAPGCTGCSRYSKSADATASSSSDRPPRRRRTLRPPITRAPPPGFGSPTRDPEPGAVSTGCAPRSVVGVQGWERSSGDASAPGTVPPRAAGSGLRPCSRLGGCGASGARGRRRGGGTFSAALRLRRRRGLLCARPLCPGTRAGRGGSAPLGRPGVPAAGSPGERVVSAGPSSLAP